MAAESLFDPIPIAAIRQARARLALAGLSVEQWAERNGFHPKTVYDVLGGKRMAIRGNSLRAAIALGLRPDPAADPDDHPHPAGRNIIAPGPSASGNRPGNLPPQACPGGGRGRAIGEPVA